MTIWKLKGNYQQYYIILIWLFVSGCTIWTNPTPNIINNDVISYGGEHLNGSPFKCIGA